MLPYTVALWTIQKLTLNTAKFAALLESYLNMIHCKPLYNVDSAFSTHRLICIWDVGFCRNIRLILYTHNPSIGFCRISRKMQLPLSPAIPPNDPTAFPILTHPIKAQLHTQAQEIHVQLNEVQPTSHQKMSVLDAKNVRPGAALDEL